MKQPISSLFVLLALLAAGCSPAPERATINIEPANGPVPYSSLEVNNNPDNFQFAIVTDRTGGHRDGVFEMGISKLNLLQPEFVMSVGDFIEGYTEDEDRLDAEWTEFNGFIDSLQAPFFYVPGNHDITNKLMYDKYKELFGKDYYHFVYRDVLFLCLNSEDNYRGAGRGTIGDEQYAWVEKVMAENTDVKWTMVFMHQPLWDQEAETLRWKDVEKLLEGRKHTVFVGHRHNYVKFERNNSKYFVLATTGGGSPLRGPAFGEFDHVVWVTMTDDGPILANLMLSGIWDENVNTEQMADYFRPLVNGRSVTMAPLFTDASTFSSGTTELRLTNDSNAPMQVALEFAANKDITSSIIRQTMTIPPNSVELVPVKLTGKGAALATLEPLMLKADVTFTGDGMPDLTSNLTLNARPEKKEYVSKSASKTLDGDLSDWASLPYEESESLTEANPFSHKGGKADGSVRFGLAYDDQFLYIGAEVTDDEMLASATARPYNQDAFQVIIDGRTEGISSLGTSLSGVLYIGMSPIPGDTANTAPFTNGDKPDGTTGVTVKTAKGYNTELAIPLSYLAVQQGGDWKTVRINVGVNDFDNDFSHRTNLWWRPDWRGAKNYPGSGTFFKK